jgi:hypothetical protein
MARGIFEVKFSLPKGRSSMKKSRGVLLGWLGANLFYLGSLALLPHREIPMALYISYSVQTLLFILSVHVFRSEPTRKNRYIFLNFAVFFALASLPAHLINFVGPEGVVAGSDKVIRSLIDQFVFRIGYFFVLAFTIVYITIDLLLRDFSTVKKYLVTVAIVGGFGFYYYSPYFIDVNHMRHTEEALQLHDTYELYDAYKTEHGVAPSEDELVALVPQMFTYHDQEAVGILYAAEKERKVRELYPYMAGLNYVNLLYRPLYTNSIQMSVLCIGFILLFFGYQYMKDPPQGAYIEKIMFLFLIFCTLEILHAYSFIHTVQWSAFTGVATIAGYISVFVLLLLSAFFGLRLKFITSAKGEFYEQELAASPGGITRWRDLLDNVVIEKFFNRKLLLGRLMVDPRTRQMDH